MARYFRAPQRTTDYPFLVITSDQNQKDHIEFFETKDDAIEAASLNTTPATPALACRIIRSGHDTEIPKFSTDHKITLVATLDERAREALVSLGAGRSRKSLHEKLEEILAQAIDRAIEGHRGE